MEKDFNSHTVEPSTQSQNRPIPKVRLGMYQTFLAILVYTLVVAAIGFLIGKSNAETTLIAQPTNSDSRIETQTPELTTDSLPSWESYDIEELGLTFSAPPELDVTNQTEVSEETSEPYLLTLYIQNTSNTDEYYQLYGIFQWNEIVPETLDIYKDELSKESIEETTVGNLPALKGQLLGERNRFVTYILLDEGVLALFTADPTTENKELTDQILETFEFN